MNAIAPMEKSDQPRIPNGAGGGQDDQALIALLAKYAGDTQGTVKLLRAVSDFGQLVAVVRSDNQEQGIVARATLQKWADGPDELHKGLAQAWIERARATIDAAKKQPQDGEVPATKGVQTHPSIHKLRAIRARKVFK